MHFTNVLVVRTDRLGDVLLTLPICGVLRREMPELRIGMLVRCYVAPLLKGNPLIDVVIEYDEEGDGLVPMHTLVDRVAAQKFDAAVVARPTPRIAWLLARARIPVRVGTGFRLYSPLFTHRVMDHRSTAERHELEYNARLLAPLGVKAPDRIPQPVYGVAPSTAAQSFVSCVLRSLGIGPDRDVVVLHPATGGSSRDWPPERFRDLSLMLSCRPNTTVAVSGTPADERVIRKMLVGAGNSAILLAGMFDLDQLAALIKRASLFVANSTGPLHLAAALGTPVIGLYPPVKVMSARRWGPYSSNAIVFTGRGPDDCSRCSRGGPCACMESITVDEVYAAASRILDTRTRVTAGARA